MEIVDVDLEILILLFIVVCFVYHYLKKKEIKGKPLPQPRGLKTYLKFFQSAWANDLHGLSLEWAREYGDIFKLNILGTNMVFINHSQLMRRILNELEYKDLTNDRPYTFIGRYGLYDEYNVAFNNSTPIQQKRRKAFHSLLKFYGDGVGTAESVILRALYDEVQHFRRQETVEISKHITCMILRMVDLLIVGDKPEKALFRMKCLDNFERAFDEIFVPGNEAFLQQLPFLRFVSGRFKRLYDELISTRTKLMNAYFSDDDAPLCDKDGGGLIGQLLKMQEQNGKEEFPDKTIRSLLAEATVASLLTTSSLINTVVVLCIKYPELQRKLYEEIQRVIGNEVPCLRRHRHRMPLVDSFIMETMRYSAGTPFMLYHSCREAILFDGYHIPKDSILILNEWYSFRHPDVWEDPWSFKARRFLDSDGNLLSPDHPLRQNLIPFGTGRRSCPGEAFAKCRVFLITVVLLGNFEFFKSPDCELPSLDPCTWSPGYAVGPDEFRCRVVPRKKECLHEVLKTSL